MAWHCLLGIKYQAFTLLVAPPHNPLTRDIHTYYQEVCGLCSNSGVEINAYCAFGIDGKMSTRLQGVQDVLAAVPQRGRGQARRPQSAPVVSLARLSMEFKETRFSREPQRCAA